MSNKTVMTGNEAVARGFYEEGGKVATGYPGSPTVQVIDALKEYKELWTSWGTNEKVALEMAIGSSITGARSMVVMKHVGLNIALDPFMTFTQTRTVGSFVLLLGDDPGLASSQNEQDSRLLAQFANIAVFDPSTPQDALDFTREAVKISEKFETPTMLRITSRLCHARGIVETNERVESEIKGFVEDPSNFCMLPPYSNAQQYFMRERMQKLEEFNNTYEINKLYEKENTDTLIITSGMVYGVLSEIDPNASILKLGMVWPLPIERIRELSNKYKNIIVLEEMMPVIEKELKFRGIPCEGKKYFPFTGELTFEIITKGLVEAGILEENNTKEIKGNATVNRSPMLCAGCPHRPVFDALKKARATVMGDIGCYSLGIQEPFLVHKTNISMGASMGMAIGMAKANRLAGINKPIVATIGDGTFFHSGLSPMVQLSDVKENITVIVMDNRTTAMTGGQKSMTTNELKKEPEVEHYVAVKSIVEACGITDVQVVDQFKVKDFQKTLREAMKREQISVIITSRPCALNFGIKNTPYYVDETMCIGCRSCVNTNCPPINMQKYEGIDELKSHINYDMCVGCSVCSQVCPVGAIKSTKVPDKDEKEMM